MTVDTARIPVIVGIGQINDRPTDPQQGMDSLDLMESALRIADQDAGGGWLARLDSLAVTDQISFPELNPVTQALAGRIGATPRIAYQTPIASGDSPVLLLNEAANRIAAGEITVAAITGGEALRTAAGCAAQAAKGNIADHNIRRSIASRQPPSYRASYGLSAPVDIYPLYENAARAAYGQSLEEAQQESGLIWSIFSQEAAVNPGAWIKTPRAPADILCPGPDNRPIAFPYNKLMVANSSVNQGAAFLVTSLAEALAAGVPEERLVYVGRGAAAHEPEDVLARDRYDRTAAMEVSISRAMELNAVTAGDLDYAELYSCFPCVPKMARRILGWPADRPASVFGGLTFGGGPIGNYMSHAVVGMVLKLREGGRKGLLFANGGYATHNHTLVIGREPPPEGALPHDFDYQAEADAKRGPVPPVQEDYQGPGRIETYTVLYERDSSPRHGIIVGRSPSGTRFLAKVPAQDGAAIAFLTDGRTEPVGTAGRAAKGDDGFAIWTVES
jgi:acetyl-CoA C-acetyltransferase